MVTPPKSYIALARFQDRFPSFSPRIARLHGGHTLKVGLADGDVFFVFFFGEIESMRREQRLAGFFEELLTGAWEASATS